MPKLHAIIWLDEPGIVWLVEEQEAGLHVDGVRYPVKVPLWVRVVETDPAGVKHEFHLPAPMHMN